MRRMNKIKLVQFMAAFVFCLSVVLSVVGGFAVGAEEKRTLKVGYVGFENFINPDDNGDMHGYGVKYLELIGQQSGYDYEYIPCSWHDSLEMLLDREIDLICTASYTDERAKIYDYSLNSFAHMQGVIYTGADNNEIYYEDYDAFEGMKVGVIRSTINIDMFSAYAQQKNFSYKQCLFDDEDEMITALKKGEIDAIATENYSEHSDLKLIGVYDTGFYYLMSYKDNDFMNDIDDAMSEIFSTNSNIQKELFDKYFTGSQRNLSLTRSEAEFVSKCGIITIGMYSDRYPLSEYNAGTGKIGGVDYDIFERVSEICGLDFYYVPITSGNSCTEELLAGKFDIAVGEVLTDIIYGDDRLIASETYLTSTAAAVGHKGKYEIIGDKPVVACRENAEEYALLAEEMFDGCEIRYYKTDEECLDAVRDGIVDYFVQNIHIVSYLLQKPIYNTLEMLPSSFFEENHVAIFSAASDAHLVSIINKAIKCLSTTEKEKIILQSTIAKPYQMSFTDAVYRYSGTLIIVAVIITIVLGIISFIGASNAKKYAEVSEKNRRLEVEMEQLRKKDEERKRAIFDISRDIRTPLNTINGISAAALKRIDDPSKISEYLEKIRASSGELQETADIITELYGNEEGNEEYENFFILDVLKEISTYYTLELNRKNVDFTVNSAISCPKLGGNSHLFKDLICDIIDELSGCAGRGGCISFNVTDALIHEDLVFVKFVVDCDRPQIADPDFAEVRKLVEKMSGAFSKELTSTRIVVTCDIPFDKTEGEEDDFSATDSAINAVIFDSDNNTSALIRMTLEKAGITAFEALNEENLLNSVDSEKCNVCFIGDSDGTGRICQIAERLRSCGKKMVIVAVAEATEDIPYCCDYVAEKSRLQQRIFKIMLELTEMLEIRKNPVKAAEGFNFTGRKILIADENKMSAEITAELLRMTGAECEVCVNGDEALKMYEIFPAGTFDAIILAIRMPVMDGCEACKKIRRSQHTDSSTIPILALSAYALKSDISAAFAAGMNGHISKPVDSLVLYKKLENVFVIR